MFLWAPSGLVLYWLTSNLFGIGQQLTTNRIIGPPKIHQVRPPAEGKAKPALAKKAVNVEPTDHSRLEDKASVVTIDADVNTGVAVQTVDVEPTDHARFEAPVPSGAASKPRGDGLTLQKTRARSGKRGRRSRRK